MSLWCINKQLLIYAYYILPKHPSGKQCTHIRKIYVFKLIAVLLIGRLSVPISVLGSLSLPSPEPTIVASIRDITLQKLSISALQIGYVCLRCPNLSFHIAPSILHDQYHFSLSLSAACWSFLY